MATDNSWMPASGRHSVGIGGSLARALKARKGTAPAPKRSNIPDRDFYSFRYNFKPPSFDSTKPGSMKLNQGKDSIAVSVEHPSTEPGEAHLYDGHAARAKEWDCVLIYDEETGTYTLEKLDSCITMNHDKKITTRPSASPLPPPMAPPKATSKATYDYLTASLDRDLLDLVGEVDADGETDHDEPAHTNYQYRREEEEEEGEEIEIPPAPAPKPKPPAPRAKPRPSDVPTKPPPPMKLAPSNKGKGRAKRDSEVASLDVEEEDLEFGKPARPARPTKRVRSSPPPQAPVSSGLALPGSAPVYAAPLPPPSRPAAVTTRAPSPQAFASDSEEDWDVVAAAVPTPNNNSVLEINLGASDDGNVNDNESEEEEIDMNLFQQEMDEHLEEADDDFLLRAVSPEPDYPAPPSARPLSLNAYAGGGVADVSDDDYSSSDSEDD